MHPNAKQFARPSSSSASHSFEDEEDDDAVLQEAWSDLVTEFEQSAGASMEGGADFVIRMGEGGFLSKIPGGMTEALATETRKGLPRSWCQTYEMPQSASFSVNRMGSREVAHALAVEWCKRNQWFFNLWKAEETAGFKYTDDDYSSYKASAAWVAFKDNLNEPSDAFVRACRIDAVRPTNTVTPTSRTEASSSS